MSLGGHFGPEVDAACLAEEPAVDRWEAGIEYPSWEQTVALARFLDVRVRDLAHPTPSPAPRGPCPRLKISGLAILSFEPAAVSAVTAGAGATERTAHGDHPDA
ncbi:hypothetical protein CEJ39_11705 [Rhodococcus pyridinivorans]|uniref:hypothetical protein n=1 Tax=Rhodococcus pyridinivorans TaxID=103816 RepID=UPI000DCAC945|nr:hypothetical protein [Rhodococcus pyridinivorans]AWZ24755.1 hypothetical protein CEJ39_11705 [Rhodococcus pyridinivorans]